MESLSSRRHFLKQSTFALGALPLLSSPFSESVGPGTVPFPDVHIFSKHLQFLNYTDMADAAASMGFKGVDLTVRPAGHVLPERVEDDLPKAAEALKKVGFTPNLMTTTVGDATSTTDIRVLRAASKAGFQQYRTNWYPYDKTLTIPESIQRFQAQLRALSALNKSLKLTGYYQNHAGLLVGSSVWELWEILKTADPAHMGVQYDIRHAMVEGGTSWPNGLRLLQPQIKALTLKDFYWAKKNGKWVVEDVPIGEGMVDFRAYFKLLKQANLRLPVSLHIEYPMGGAESGATRLSIPQNDLFAAMKRDLNRLRELWEAA